MDILVWDDKSHHPELWFLCLSSLVTKALFLFINIHIVEKRLTMYTTGYDMYRKSTCKLLPLLKKRG